MTKDRLAEIDEAISSSVASIFDYKENIRSAYKYLDEYLDSPIEDSERGYVDRQFNKEVDTHLGV